MNIDRAVVQERLRLIRELVADLETVGDVSAARLAEDRLTRHAVERILTQLVDLASAVNAHLAAALNGVAPANYQDSFRAAAATGALSEELAIELAPSAGMRNVLTHEYVKIDLAKVAGAVPMAREGYRRYVREVARYLRDTAR